MAKWAMTAAAMILGVAGAAHGVDVTVDQAESFVDVELCILGGNCDSDQQSITGFASIELDDNNQPTQITFSDFSFALTGDINLNIGIFLGDLDAAATNLTVDYGNPGVDISAPIVGTSFTLANVPVAPGGTITYDASGTVCIGLAAASLPCNDSINIADFGVITADAFTGDVSVNADTVTLEAMVALTVVLDESDPDLAAISVMGFATGTAKLPPPPADCDGDIDGDDDADSADLNILLANFGGGVEPGTDGDLDGDADVDSADLNLLLSAFGNVCTG